MSRHAYCERSGPHRLRGAHPIGGARGEPPPHPAPARRILATKAFKIEEELARAQSYSIDWDARVDERAELAAV